MKSWKISDLLKIKSPLEVAVSSDGAEYVYALRTLNEDKGEYRVKLWRQTLASPAQAVPLTQGAGKDQSPKYSPDGQWIGFLSDRQVDAEDEEKRSRLYVLPRSGGEARCITENLGNVYDYAFSPTENVVFAIVDAEKSSFEEDQEKSRTEEKRDVTLEERSSEPKRICKIELADAKVTTIYRRDYGLLELAVSPNGKEIVFCTNLTGLNNDWEKMNLWLLCEPAAATSNLPAAAETLWEATQLVTRKGASRGARFSPDGRYVAYIAPRFENSEHSQSEAWLVPVDGSAAPFNLTQSIQVTADVQQLEWLSTDRLLLQVEKGLYAPLLLVEGVPSQAGRPEDGASWRLFGEEQVIVRGLAVDATGRTVVFTAETSTQPFEVFTVQGSDTKPVRVTDFHADWKDYLRADVREFRWTSFDGQEMEGVLALPPAADGTDSKPPLILQIHGGPAWHTTRGFSHYLNIHWLASLGYAVFLPNYRGGIGYGQDYLYANNRDLGGGDYQDIMTGVDAVSRTGLIDPERMGVTGGSYGGYMTNWIIGHDHRFRAAVSEFGIWSLFTDFGNSSMRNWETMYLGRYWESEALYLERSPSRYVRGIQTPVLIIHGDADDNTFISNSKEMYNALLEAEKTVEFVHYPREGHGIREPRHREDELRKIAEWFSHYLPTHHSLRSTPLRDWGRSSYSECNYRAVDVQQTDAYRGLGEGYEKVVAVRIEWQPVVAVASEPSKSADKTPSVKMAVGGVGEHNVYLVWRGAEPHQRPSVLATYEVAPTGVVLGSSLTVVSGEMQLMSAEPGSAVLLFPATALQLAPLGAWELTFDDVRLALS